MNVSRIQEALETIGPLDYQEGPDYATITSPAFQMMTVQPQAVLTLLEMWPAALFEINSLKQILAIVRDNIVRDEEDVFGQNLQKTIDEVLK